MYLYLSSDFHFLKNYLLISVPGTLTQSLRLDFTTITKPFLPDPDPASDCTSGSDTRGSKEAQSEVNERDLFPPVLTRERKKEVDASADTGGVDSSNFPCDTGTGGEAITLVLQQNREAPGLRPGILPTLTLTTADTAPLLEHTTTYTDTWLVNSTSALA